MKKNWTQKTITELLKKTAYAEGYRLIEVTKKIDGIFKPTDLSRWMDKSGGHYGGWYHRVKHGHDPLMNGHKVLKKFGLKGVAKYPGELLRDFSTPHGVPIPGTQYLVKGKVLSAKTATQWCSLNIMDVATGGLALYSTFELHKKSKNKQLSKTDVILASVGVITKISAGVTTHNPVLIISGLADTVILIQNYEQFEFIKNEWLIPFLSSDFTKSSAVGIAAGVGTTLGSTALMTAFGTASTGTAIVSLSGAAATKATLAAFGGGALAAGGAGVIGGVAVLCAAGVATTVGVSYLSRKYYFSNQPS